MVTYGEEVGNVTRGGRTEMGADDGVFVFVGTYPDTESAQADYELVKKLHSNGGIDALVGILFPPSIVVGAAAGGLIGHLWRGMSRDEMKDLGEAREALDEGEAALVVVGEDKLEEMLKKELKGTLRTYEKEIDADVAELRKELDKAIDELKA
jgi:hypothetical protein